jgi:hypothetical protein
LKRCVALVALPFGDRQALAEILLNIVLRDPVTLLIKSAEIPFTVR